MTEFKSCTRLRVLSVATSSSVVVQVVLHSYPLCQQPVCVCVCLGGIKRGNKKENKSKGSVGYFSVLSQVCQTKTSTL